MTRKHTDCAVAVVGLLILGCGGSSVTNSSTTPLAATDKITFNLPPETGANFPDHIDSIRFTIVGGKTGGSDLTWVINCPKNRGMRIFATTPPSRPVSGKRKARVEYFSGHNATGNIVASSLVSVVIRADGTLINDNPNYPATPLFSVAITQQQFRSGSGFMPGWPEPSVGVSGPSNPQIVQISMPPYGTRVIAIPPRLVSYSMSSGDVSAMLSPDGSITYLKEGPIVIEANMGGVLRRLDINVPAPAGTISRSLNRRSNALEWESSRNILWSAMGAGDAAAQTVAAIDPSNGTITRTIPVGGIASTMTISPNGQSMWIGLEGSSAVRKISLPGESLSATIAAPFAGITSRIGQIIVDPYDDDRIIVVHHDAHNNHAVVVVDHGTVISANAPRGFTSAAWIGPNRILAMGMFGNHQSFNFSPSGFVGESGSLLPGGGFWRGGKIAQIGNSLFTSLGTMYDAQTLALEHAFAYNVSLPQAITGNQSRNRVYTLNSAYFGVDTISRPGEVKSMKLRSFEMSSGRIIGSMRISIDTDYFRSFGWGYTPIPFPSLVPVGNSGVAFNTPTAIYIVDNAPTQ